MTNPSRDADDAAKDAQIARLVNLLIDCQDCMLDHTADSAASQIRSPRYVDYLRALNLRIAAAINDAKTVSP